jgi:hypothetical protein
VKVSSVSSYLFSHKIIVDRELFFFSAVTPSAHKYICTSFKVCSKIIAHLAIEHLALVVFSIFLYSQTDMGDLGSIADQNLPPIGIQAQTLDK